MTERIKLTEDDIVISNLDNDLSNPHSPFFHLFILPESINMQKKENGVKLKQQILENQKIVDGVLSLIKEERKKRWENIPKEMEGVCIILEMTILEKRIRKITGKNIEDLSTNQHAQEVEEE